MPKLYHVPNTTEDVRCAGQFLGGPGHVGGWGPGRELFETEMVRKRER